MIPVADSLRIIIHPRYTFGNNRKLLYHAADTNAVADNQRGLIRFVAISSSVAVSSEAARARTRDATRATVAVLGFVRRFAVRTTPLFDNANKHQKIPLILHVCVCVYVCVPHP